jgi:hypothetical protein
MKYKKNILVISLLICFLNFIFSEAVPTSKTVCMAGEVCYCCDPVYNYCTRLWREEIEGDLGNYIWGRGTAPNDGAYKGSCVTSINQDLITCGPGNPKNYEDCKKASVEPNYPKEVISFKCCFKVSKFNKGYCFKDFSSLQCSEGFTKLSFMLVILLLLNILF